MTNIEKSVELISWLLNESGLTVYRISKDTELSATAINRITVEGRPIEGLTLKTAKVLEAYATQLKNKGMDKMEKSAMEMVQNRNNEVRDPEIFEDIFENELQDYREHAELCEKFGSVKSDFGVLALLQQPYIDGTDDNAYYTALAVSDQGDHYNITWDIKEGMEDYEDEQERCDWDRPADISAI